MAGNLVFHYDFLSYHRMLFFIWCCVISPSQLTQYSSCFWPTFMSSRQQELHSRVDVISNMILILSEQVPTLNLYILNEGLTERESSNTGVSQLKCDYEHNRELISIYILLLWMMSVMSIVFSVVLHLYLLYCTVFYICIQYMDYFLFLIIYIYIF